MDGGAVSTIPAADKTYDVEKLASDTAWLISAETQVATIGQCRMEASKVQQSLSTCRQELMKQSAALENGQ